MKNPVAQNASWTNSPAITCQHSILENLSTAEFAAALCQKQESLRSELCRTGSVKAFHYTQLELHKLTS